MKKFEFKKTFSVKRFANVDLSHLDRQLANVEGDTACTPNRLIELNNNEDSTSFTRNDSFKSSNTSSIKSYFNKLSTNKSNNNIAKNGLLIFKLYTFIIIFFNFQTSS